MYRIQFSTNKYTLIYFVQNHNFDQTATVQIDTTTIALSLTVQALELQLDSELK
jgi:hypothetical protein